MNNVEWVMPKTIAERAEKIAHIHHFACFQLRNTFEVKRLGNMVQRYQGNLRAYIRASNAISETFNTITTGIYEGKDRSSLL